MLRRLFDIVLGTVLAILLTPLVIVLAVGAALSLRAWPFFVQRRVGKGGREFRIIKIRTLPPATPRYADKYSLACVYVPPFCGLLRNLHLDELPQLYLVPLGRMSLVGPRPEMMVLHNRYEPGFAAMRTSVRPGCSGLWQIGRSTGSLLNEDPVYDRTYIAHASLRLDLWVVWRTIVTMVHVSRPTTIEDIPAWALSGRRGRAEIIDIRTDVEVETPISDLALDA